jgi:predicted AlkP superfamily phosphohydrolase/phosphomutase
MMVGGLGCAKEDTAPPTLAEWVAASHATGVKILLIGIDGATFRILGPMAESGKLPEFKKLMDRGAYGNLRSVTPMLSPALWTTMVTGKPRGAHGIVGFMREETKKTGHPELVRSDDRRTLALWNIMGPFERSAGFIGWWVTWPAEPVHDYIVSDRVADGRWVVWTNGKVNTGQTHPPELIDEIRDYVHDPLKPDMNEIRSLVEFDEDEQLEFQTVAMPIYAHSLSTFKFAHAAQRSIEDISMYMLDRQDQPDLMGVFLIANDPICHTFWHYFEPDAFIGVDHEVADRLGKLIPNYYQHNDAFLGRILEKVDADTVVMIVSDHGFQPSGKIPKPSEAGKTEILREAALNEGQVAVGQAGKHHPDGVLIASGGPIREGFHFETRVDLVDVTPTILALLGLPIPEDMTGRVVTEIIDPAFIQKYPIRHISSYEKYIHREEAGETAEGMDEAMRARLEALGYTGRNEVEERAESTSKPALEAIEEK